MVLEFPWWVFPAIIIFLLILAASTVMDLLRVQAVRRAKTETEKQTDIIEHISYGIQDIIMLMGGDEDHMMDPNDKDVKAVEKTQKGRPITDVELPPEKTQPPAATRAEKPVVPIPEMLHREPLERQPEETRDPHTRHIDTNKAGRGWTDPAAPRDDDGGRHSFRHGGA